MQAFLLFGGISLGLWAALVLALRALKRSGGTARFHNLDVAPFCVTWTSTALAATIVRRGRHRGLRYLYACGAVFGAAGLVVAMVLLAASLVSNTAHAVHALGSRVGVNATVYHGQGRAVLAGPERHPEVHEQERAMWEVKALIPGVNLPLLHFSYVFLAVFISLVVHEAGHAIAASSEGVKVVACGVFLCVIVPGAFVRLDLDEAAAAQKRLRIYAAGAWHNAVLAVTCKAFRRFLPYVLSPFYLIPDGSAYVSGVAPTSALSRQLAAGDAIFAIDNCRVTLPLPAAHSHAQDGAVNMPGGSADDGGADRWVGCLQDIAQVGHARASPLALAAQAGDLQRRADGISGAGVQEDRRIGGKELLSGFCIDSALWRDALERDVGGVRGVGGMVGWGGHSDCCSHLQMQENIKRVEAIRSDAGGEAGWQKDPGGGSNDGGEERGYAAGSQPSFPSEEEKMGQERLQEEIEREATLEAINADRGERDGFGEREEWSDPEVQGRFKAARERAAARRRARAQKEKEKQRAVAGGRAAGKGTRRLLGLDREDGSEQAEPESGEEGKKGQLCFVEGGFDEDGRAFSLLNVSRDAGACLSARVVVVGQRARCSAHLDCIRQAGRETMCIHPAPEPPDLFLPLQVLHASSAQEATGASLFSWFGRRESALKGLKGAEPVLFLGSVQELYEAVEMSPYRLRGMLLFDFVARLDLPLVLSRLLAYIAAISASIAVFNLVPASGLDGEFTLHALCDMAERRGGVAMLPMEGRAAGWANVGRGVSAWRNRVVRGSGVLLVISLMSSLARV